MRATRLAVTLAALASVLAVALPSHAAAQSVVVAGFQFAPSGWVTIDPFNAAGGAGTVEVAAAIPSFARGDVITWTSADPVPHAVFRISGPTNFSTRPTMALPGATSSLSTAGFLAGTYVYGCTVHVGMKGAFRLV